MPGLRIMHRMVDVGFNEPTRIYDVVEKQDGRLDMQLLLEVQGLTLNDLAEYLKQQEVQRPAVLVDPDIRIIYELKQRGIRVR